MSEVFVHCVREDKSIGQIFSVEGPTVDEFIFYFGSNDVCPIKNYICKFGYKHIKYLNIYYDNELQYKVTLDEDYHSEMGKGSFLVEDVKENDPYLH